MRRYRNVLIAAAVVAGLLVAFLATRSDGADDNGVRTTSSKNCPPVARLDAAATTPDAAVAIDVLANDTDPDGDPLIFQILKTTGGTSTVDDGATPTEAGDDRVLFTPAVPAPPAAVIEYQAIDPRGAIATSTVEVSVNDLGTLPDGLRSEPVSTDGDTDLSDCDQSPVTTRAPGTTLLLTPTTDLLLDEEITATTRAGSGSSTKTKPKSTTTTTKKSSTPTTSGNSGTTQPTSPPTTPTTQPGPTTTQSPPTTNGACGEQPAPGEPGYSEWYHCTYGA
jgi:hypothetical protein